MKKTKKPVSKTTVRKPKPTSKASMPKKSATAAPRHVALKRQARRQIRKSAPLHKRIVLHPASVLALLAVGVFLTTWTFRTVADTSGTTISATIEAPALTSAATISTPSNNDTVTSNSITVTGSCPAASYVNLTINGVFSGTAMCTSGTYSILGSLSHGTNTLQVQDYNLTDQAGPSTASITVNDASVLGASTVRGSGPLVLTSSFTYKTYSTAENFSWPLSISGGQGPYTLSVDWGDGNKPSILTSTAAGTLNIVHHYSVNGYHVVRLQAVDAQAGVWLLQLAALITDPGSSVVPGVTTVGSGGTGGLFHQQQLSQILTQTRVWLLVAWPSFIIVTLMAVSFWLGERQELQAMFAGKRHRPAKHAA
jgi:hypothetical protein